MSRRGVGPRRVFIGIRRRLPARAGILGLAVRRRLARSGYRRGPRPGRVACAATRSSAARSRVADVLAIVGAFVLTLELSRRSLQLTWAGVAAVPILLVGAKLTGLYDRDETLLRKTTLDEAPKLFQLATLCALVAWLAGGLLVSGDARTATQALILWLALAALLILVRAGRAHRSRCAIAPAERCLFIGDEMSAATIRSKLGWPRRRQGDRSSRTSTSTRSRRGRPTPSPSRGSPRSATSPRRSTCTARSSPRAAPTPARCSNLVRTLKAVGVRVSVLPRLLEVVGSSVEFDDLHGVTVMGVRRFDLTRSSASVQARLRPGRRLARPARRLAAADRDRDRDQARQPRPGVLPPAARRPPRQALPHAQVPHDGPRRGGDEGLAAPPQRGAGGALQDRRGPARHARRAAGCGAARWTSCRSCSTSCAAR